MGERDTGVVYPGVFSSPEMVHHVQRQAVRWSNAQVKDAGPNADVERARLIEDARELRYRMLVKSAVLWAVIGLPAILTMIYIAQLALVGYLAGRIDP